MHETINPSLSLPESLVLDLICFRERVPWNLTCRPLQKAAEKQIGPWADRRPRPAKIPLASGMISWRTGGKRQEAHRALVDGGRLAGEVQ